MIEVSLIIPTHNRADSLKSTIASALDLDYPADRFEIIIVDNASNDETATLIESYQKKNNGKKLRCIQEAQLGLHYARHAGVRAAAGELLLFTDDDASFDSGLLKAYVNAFTKNLAMVAAGGPVRPIWNQPPPPWLLEYIGDSKQFSILSLMEPFEEFRLAEDCYFFWRQYGDKKKHLQPHWLSPRTDRGEDNRRWRDGITTGYQKVRRVDWLCPGSDCVSPHPAEKNDGQLYKKVGLASGWGTNVSALVESKNTAGFFGTGGINTNPPLLACMAERFFYPPTPRP